MLRQHGPDDALELLRSRDVDIAVVDSWQPPRDEAGLIRIPLLKDPIMIAGPVEHDTWICAPPDQPSRRTADEVMVELDIQPTVRWEFEGLATIADLVADGVGAAVLPQLALHKVDVPTTSLDRHRRIDAVIRSGSRVRPAITAALEAITQGMNPAA